jgi:hypothetical protein
MCGKVINHLPEASDDAGKRIVGDMHCDAGLFFEQFVKSAEKRTAAAKCYALVQDIAGKFRRRFFDDFPYCIDDLP